MINKIHDKKKQKKKQPDQTKSKQKERSKTNKCAIMIKNIYNKLEDRVFNVNTLIYRLVLK